MFKLFIDDERFPPSDGPEWIIARTCDDVLNIIMVWGMPGFISFDHDLGEDEPTGYDIAKSLVDMDMNGFINIPNYFTCYVHSQNPIGKANIEAYLNNYLEFKRSKQDGT